MRCGLASSSIIGAGTKYGLETLNQCGKKVKTKSQKGLRANSFVWTRFYNFSIIPWLGEVVREKLEKVPGESWLGFSPCPN